MKRTNAEAIQIIKESEGFRSKPYPCPAGVLSIGYGTTRGVRPYTAPITREEGEELLRRDIRQAEAVVDAYVKVPLNANQYSALVSFVHNVGPGKAGYKDGFVWLKNGHNSRMLRLLNAGNYVGAAQQFDLWVSGGGKKLPGLVTRRAREKTLFLTPVKEA